MALRLVLVGNVYHVRGTVETTRGRKVRVRRSTGYSKREKEWAEKERRRLYEQAVYGSAFEEAKGETVGDLVRQFRMRPEGVGKTDAYVLDRIERLLGGTELAELKPVVLMPLVTGDGKAKPGTVRRKMATVEAMLKYGERIGMEVPKLTLPKPAVDDARIRFLPEAQRDEMLECASDEFRPLLQFLFYTGVRLGEAERLEWQDVVYPSGSEDVARVTVWSRKGKNKRKRMRTIPLNRKAKEALDLAGRQDAGPVWRREDGRVWNRTEVYRAFHEAREKAGIEDFRVHDCRHTFASLLVQKGVGLRQVAELLGHSNLNMVMRYAHLAPTHLSDAVRALD